VKQAAELLDPGTPALPHVNRATAAAVSRSSNASRKTAGN